jgi:hypothetical protein
MIKTVVITANQIAEEMSSIPASKVAANNFRIFNRVVTLDFNNELVERISDVLSESLYDIKYTETEDIVFIDIDLVSEYENYDLSVYDDIKAKIMSLEAFQDLEEIQTDENATKLNHIVTIRSNMDSNELHELLSKSINGDIRVLSKTSSYSERGASGLAIFIITFIIEGIEAISFGILANKLYDRLKEAGPIHNIDGLRVEQESINPMQVRKEIGDFLGIPYKDIAIIEVKKKRLFVRTIDSLFYKVKINRNGHIAKLTRV